MFKNLEYCFLLDKVNLFIHPLYILISILNHYYIKRNSKGVKNSRL